MVRLLDTGSVLGDAAPMRAKPQTNMCMTQAEVAKRLGIPVAQVCKIEREALLKLRAACDAEGITLQDLLDGLVNYGDD